MLHHDEGTVRSAGNAGEELPQSFEATGRSAYPDIQGRPLQLVELVGAVAIFVVHWIPGRRRVRALVLFATSGCIQKEPCSLYCTVFDSISGWGEKKCPCAWLVFQGALVGKVQEGAG